MLLIAPTRSHDGANEYKTVGLLPVEYHIEQLQLGHIFNIINVKAPAYLRTNGEMEPATWHVAFQE